MLTPLPHDHGHLPESLQAVIPKSEIFEKVSDIFKLLNDGRRLQIFWLLCHCEDCVTNISAVLDTSSSVVSHHLKLLKAAGLVISRREGKEVCYTAVSSERTEVLHDMIERVVEVSCPSGKAFEEARAYDSLTQAMTDIHDYLTSDLKTRHTIDELSQRYHINPTTLKVEFKRTYGQPIASYMKDYRLRRAMELLAQGELPIAEVALAVGYENQGKFTQAFKALTGMLPREYRKASRNG